MEKQTPLIHRPPPIHLPNTLKKARIGLALSGGGMRAAIFHLGVMQYYACTGMFDNIASISTVSGASITVGVVLAVNNNQWPTATTFLHDSIPKVRELFIQHNIQTAALLRLPFLPQYWRNRVGLIAKLLEKKWCIHGNLQDLPPYPYWEINCTTFETGNNFRIRRDYMGDSTVGYVQNPTLPLSHVIAASAAFPVLIGPYILPTQGMKWTQDKHGHQAPVAVDDHYSLWDGGVYDNMGLDPLYTTTRGLDNEIDYLVVSNASAPIKHQYRAGRIANLRRLLDISMNQVDVLRSKQIIVNIVAARKGKYLKIGTTSRKHDIYQPFSKDCLTREQAAKVRDYPTTLNSPTAQDFDLILRHGYETAAMHPVL